MFRAEDELELEVDILHDRPGGFLLMVPMILLVSVFGLFAHGFETTRTFNLGDEMSCYICHLLPLDKIGPISEKSRLIRQSTACQPRALPDPRCSPYSCTHEFPSYSQLCLSFLKHAGYTTAPLALVAD